jgi:hypothetical protein
MLGLVGLSILKVRGAQTLGACQEILEATEPEGLEVQKMAHVFLDRPAPVQGADENVTAERPHEIRQAVRCATYPFDDARKAVLRHPKIELAIEPPASLRQYGLPG